LLRVGKFKSKPNAEINTFVKLEEEEKKLLFETAVNETKNFN
jgi:hypothetical protein